MTTRRKLLILGLEGLDWRLVHPLLDAGRLPNLSRLVDCGVIATLETAVPLVSPLLWTTVATGQPAWRHGVLHDRYPTGGDPGDGPPDGTVPAGGAGRREPVLWEYATRAGLRAHVLGWPATYPAEAVGGVFLADDAASPASSAPLPVEALQAGPDCDPNLPDDLAELRVGPGEIGRADLRALVPGIDEPDVVTDPRVATLAVILADAASRHCAATWVLESDPEWDLAMIHYSLLDELATRFMAFHPPRRRHVSGEDFARFREVVAGGHILLDAMLGRLVELAGADTTVLLVSTRGFLTGASRPAPGPGEQAEAADVHCPVGLAVLSGPGARRDERLDGGTLRDIVPTALTLLGLPVPAGLPGKVWSDALEVNLAGAAAVGLVASPGDEFPPGARVDYAERSQRWLSALVEPGGAALSPGLAAAWELRYNLARSVFSEGLVADALPIFEELARVWPERAGPGLHRVLCLAALGRPAESRELLEEFAGRSDGGLRSFGGKRPAHAPQFDLMRGILAFTEGKAEAALECFLRARRARAQLPGLSLQLGRVFLALGRTREAATAFRRALAIAPEDPEANLGAAVAALGLGRYRVAADRALRAATRAPGNPEIHRVLAAAVERMGKDEG